MQIVKDIEHSHCFAWLCLVNCGVTGSDRTGNQAACMTGNCAGIVMSCRVIEREFSVMQDDYIGL